jgi:hypothetical protein
MTVLQSAPRSWAPVAAAAALLVSGASASAASLTEGFTTGVPAGWTVVNNSVPVGGTSWGQGVPTVFPAQAGPTDSYVTANYNSTGNNGDISTWLITPTLTFNNGDVVSFWTRTVTGPTYADRLELRFSNVGGVNVGNTATSVGSFTQLLVSVNPSLSPAGYPSTWTLFSATIAGLGGPTSGALAFRYFVPDGGFFGNNSDYIGVDTFSITPVPEPATYLLMALGVGAVLARRARAARV